MFRCLEELYVVDPEDQLRRIEENWGKRYNHQMELSLPNMRFHEWKSEPSSRVLWLTGSTRVGQGIFMSSIATELIKSGECPLSVCVCESKRDADAAYVFRALIWMLTKSRPQLGQYLKDLDSPGKQSSVDVLDIHLLSSVLSNMLQDPMIMTAYLFIDQEHICIDQSSFLREFIFQDASDPASKVKWVLTGDARCQPSWAHASWVVNLNLDRGVQRPESMPFKMFTSKNMTSGNGVWYRIRGLDRDFDVDKARNCIISMLSSEEQHKFDPQIILVPTCDDGYTSQTILLNSNFPPEFLISLEEDICSSHCINTSGGRLHFDRHFRGFTQMYANPPDKVIIAEYEY